MNKLFQLLTSCAALLLTACSTSVPIDQRDAVTRSIDQQSQQLIDNLGRTYPNLSEKVTHSYGYATVFMSRLKVPLIGGGSGIGAIYNNQDGSVIYIDVNRYDLGAGLAYGNYQTVTLFESKASLEQFANGGYRGAFAKESNWSDGSSDVLNHYFIGENSDYPTYVYYESDTNLVGSLQLQTISVNHSLTDTGLGDARVANKEQEIERTAPAKWNRALPFFAQDVIDKGYTLPKPYGVSLIYAETKQAMTIDELEAGFSFWDKGRVPMKFVTFDNNYSHSESPQLKLDAWLFPFMNVFASIGKVNGMAHIEFELDGNDLIDQIGLDCSGFPPKPVCQKVYDALKDNSLYVPLDVDLDGYNYTVGTILAAGWRDYFVTVPISFSYIDMKNAKAEELVVNISPRVGKQIATYLDQSVDVYVGASYLDSDLTIIGQHEIPLPGDGAAEYIDYKIRQENIDKWSFIAGANYNFNRTWSLSMEYGQKGSDKRQFVSALNYRF
ncbi:hypothetical protein FLM48_16915 [Shewanella sp. Scap07]|uniref:hypothetical protein n=1 Tax=Shewanella sp. Scap07 TaxID=2589987 RepID=UPI0015B89CBA|nr:hypothetical protein [Shewanella sp. Scap07]QLE86603.1 hypothetical protein FLM48_16915 [Shewanella sp. Scap07]